VYVLSVGLALAAGIVFVTVDLPLEPIPAPVEVPWLVLAAAFAVTEVFVVHLQIRRNAHSFSLSEAPLVVGLVFAAPVALIAARVVGAALTLVLHRRQRGVKLAFNVAHLALEACLAVAIFRPLLGGAEPVSWRGWLAALAVTAITDLLSAAYLSAAISLNEGRLERELLREAVTFGLIAAAANTSLAILAVTVLWHDPTAAWALCVVALLAVVTYRSYTSLRAGHARLEVLYSFTRDLEHSANLEQLAGSVLRRTREVLRAERAELVLLPVAGGDAVRIELVGDEVTARRTGEDLGRHWWSGALAGRAVYLPQTREQAVDLKDAMAAPLVGDGVVGVIVVADRVGDVSTFDADDLKLFETIANHVTVALENGRLIQRLRERAAENEHQAMHDALTGLPNRRMFQAAVRDAIARDPEGAAAVLLMDLDRFKEVNDTLGHAVGDLLLRETGHRLQQRVGDRGLVARLGGDEFGIVLPGAAGRQVVADAADLLRSFEQPFELGDLSLSVYASVGITIAPDHGSDSATLLQRADVAMYSAKEDSSSVEIYEPARDQHSRRRLALSSDLHQGIESGQLVVHYQPKADLRSGCVVGAEALVRWEHPDLGLVPADEFVPLAEQTGLIRPLTVAVLDAALGACADWRHGAGLRVPVAVNLSIRGLLDASVVADVDRLLGRHGVDPEDLTLEITESAVMGDAGRTFAALDRLDRLGVRLSIDDFGTGHSSLSYLKRLPVDEVKIDKSFVFSLARDQADEAIVRSVIDLGHNLGLRVVAEGVENQETWSMLHRLGCDAAQGYLLSRPVPADDFGRWVARSGRGVAGSPPPVPLRSADATRWGAQVGSSAGTADLGSAGLGAQMS
jgi:diguanylate cyclase (GGDEF)-like protein